MASNSSCIMTRFFWEPGHDVNILMYANPQKWEDFFPENFNIFYSDEAPDYHFAILDGFNANNLYFPAYYHLPTVVYIDTPYQGQPVHQCHFIVFSSQEIKGTWKMVSGGYIGKEKLIESAPEFIDTVYRGM